MWLISILCYPLTVETGRCTCWWRENNHRSRSACWGNYLNTFRFFLTFEDLRFRNLNVSPTLVSLNLWMMWVINQLAYLQYSPDTAVFLKYIIPHVFDIISRIIMNFMFFILCYDRWWTSEKLSKRQMILILWIRYRLRLILFCPYYSNCFSVPCLYMSTKYHQLLPISLHR